MTQAATTDRPTTARPRSRNEHGTVPGVPDQTDALLIPPHDLAAEAAVLGSMIIDGDVFASLISMGLTKEAFFKEDNEIAYGVMMDLYKKGGKVDAMILHSTLKTRRLLEQLGGLEYIKELANSVPTSAHCEVYAAIVLQKWKIRLLIRAAHATLKDCYESGDHDAALMERAMARVFKASETCIINHPLPMSTIMPAFVEAMDAQSKIYTLPGLPTGFSSLDNLTGGLQKGEMILLAARPSVGKTAFALCIMDNVGIGQQQPCAMFSLEMARDAIAMRLLSSRSSVDSNRIRRNTLSNEEKDRLGYAAGHLCSPLIFIDDTPSIGLPELRAKALRLRQQHGIRLLVVDYLGLMKTERRENRNQEVGMISAGLKALARELNIPVIVLSQLNRNCEDEQRLPRSSDLRDSGNLEQDADVILLLHREEIYHRGDKAWKDDHPEEANQAKLILSKQRNGAVDVITLAYSGYCTRFFNLNEGAAQ